jgi:hypothetical protein
MRNKDTYFLAGSRILTFCCDIIINTGYEILLAAWLFPDVAVSLYIFLLELYRVNIVAIFNTEYLAFLIVLIIMCPPPPISESTEIRYGNFFLLATVRNTRQVIDCDCL